ncbi:MAG: hypothetical protein AAB955_02360 [Patescibacteria group bacterium]
MNTLLKVGSIAFLAALPVAAFADTLIDVANTIGDIVGIVTPIVVAIALILFFWNLAMYFIGKEEDKKKAVSGMIYGVLILFVMVSIWGIVNVLQDTFNVGGTQTVTPPNVQGI